jgi:hypothetical protein
MVRRQLRCEIIEVVRIRALAMNEHKRAPRAAPVEHVEHFERNRRCYGDESRSMRRSVVYRRVEHALQIDANRISTVSPRSAEAPTGRRDGRAILGIGRRDLDGDCIAGCLERGRLPGGMLPVGSRLRQSPWAADAFTSESAQRTSEPAVDLKALHAKIGQQALEIDFLSGALGPLPGPRSALSGKP